MRDRTLADQPSHPAELCRNRLPALDRSGADTGARGLVGVRGTVALLGRVPEERPVTDNTPVFKVEGIKFTSDYLRGTIAEELAGVGPGLLQ